jgi:hypothetical protein
VNRVGLDRLCRAAGLPEARQGASGEHSHKGALLPMPAPAHRRDIRWPANIIMFATNLPRGNSHLT